MFSRPAIRLQIDRHKPSSPAQGRFKMMKHSDGESNFTNVFRSELGRFTDSHFEDEAPQYCFTRDDLEVALEAGQFEMYYQPKVRTTSRMIEGAEALLRWNHPEYGLLSPVQFVATAESSGFIQELGAWIIRQVSRFNSHARKKHPHFSGRIALNVSGSQFNQPAYLSAVLKATERLQFPNHLLEIELTESVVLEDIERAAELMKLIRSYGITIAIDDFGTGFSSMQVLARLPINTLKLDMSFIQHIAHSDSDRKIVRNMLALCKDLNLTSVAEGVEEEVQAQILTDWQCDYLQGYLFARPLPEAMFLGMIG